MLLKGVVLADEVRIEPRQLAQLRGRGRRMNLTGTASISTMRVTFTAPTRQFASIAPSPVWSLAGAPTATAPWVGASYRSPRNQNTGDTLQHSLPLSDCARQRGCERFPCRTWISTYFQRCCFEIEFITRANRTVPEFIPAQPARTWSRGWSRVVNRMNIAKVALDAVSPPRRPSAPPPLQPACGASDHTAWRTG